jgi:hypothetical protein
VPQAGAYLSILKRDGRWEAGDVYQLDRWDGAVIPAGNVEALELLRYRVHYANNTILLPQD